MNKVLLVRNVMGFGGGEVYQLNLAKMLKENGFEPVIITNSLGLILRAKKAGYKVVVPPYFKKQNLSGWRNVMMPLYFVKMHELEKWYERIFREYRPEVVNIQSRDDFLAATAAAQKCGVRVLWTDHVDFRNWVLWNVNVRFKNIIGKMILQMAPEAEEVIFVSEKIYEETKEMIEPRKIRNARVIQNGVFDDFNKYKDVKPAPQSFVFIGRVVEEKGINELLEAFSKVRKKYPKATLDIYGAGEIERYQELAGEGVRFCGETEEPIRALSKSEIFVLPSHREGLPLSLLEAMMMKKTIIASDVDGNVEAVENGKTGILVPAGNVNKLEEAMLKVLDDPKYAKKLADEARKKYEKEFNFEQIFTEKMLPLYNSEKEKE